MNKDQLPKAVENLKALANVATIKSELASLIVKLSTAIQKSQLEGKIPSDYSLGFANGLILFEHKLNARDGGPTFFDRTTSIGALPKPVALRTPGEIEKEYNSVAARAKAQEINYYQGQVVKHARAVVEAMQAIENFERANPEEQSEDLVKAFSNGLAGVLKAIDQFDHMMEKTQEGLDAQKKALEQLSQEDQSTEGAALHEEAEASEPSHLRVADSESGEQPEP